MDKRTYDVLVETHPNYHVLIRNGMLSDAGTEISTHLPKCRKAAIITDSNVAALYARTVSNSLASSGISSSVFVFEAGESSKTPENWLQIIEFLASNSYTRSDAVITLGGGVAGDMGGFAASCWQRGMPCVHIPTSLLAMADSAIGGKTAVNLPQGKNQLGTFHQPAVVLCDPDVLKTLPAQERLNGLAEVFKYALLGEHHIYEAFENGNVWDDLTQIIAACVQSKAAYVQNDELDEHNRRMLNLGHTFAHAIEQCSQYTIPHGLAVSVGISCACRLAVKLKLLTSKEAEHIETLQRRFELPTECPYSTWELLPFVLRDKKKQDDRIPFILPVSGLQCVIRNAEKDDIQSWLQYAVGEA